MPSRQRRSLRRTEGEDHERAELWKKKGKGSGLLREREVQHEDWFALGQFEKNRTESKDGVGI